MKTYFPLARQADILTQEIDGETLVYDLKTNKAVCLNETSFAVWQNCDGTNTLNDISSLIEKKFGQKVNDELISFAITQLNNENLLESNEIPDQFSGFSRRDVIKRIGFGSMIALPIVAAVTAPMAINAQSCPSPPGSVGLGQPCTEDCECLAGLNCSKGGCF